MIELKDLKDKPDRPGLWWVVDKFGVRVPVIVGSGLNFFTIGQSKLYKDHFVYAGWIHHDDYIKQIAKFFWSDGFSHGEDCDWKKPFTKYLEEDFENRYNETMEG